MFGSNNKRIALFDVDQTIFSGYSGSEMCVFLKPESSSWVDDMSERYRAGEVSYESVSVQIIEKLTSFLGGRSQDETRSLLQDYWEGVSHNIFPWVRPVFDELRREGFKLALVSGTVEPFLQILNRKVGADYVLGSTCEVQDAAFTGKVSRFLGNHEKQKVVEGLMNSAPASLAMAFGDSPGDVAMLEMAEYAFVYEPHERELREAAALREDWFLVDRNTIYDTVRQVLARLPKA